LRIQPSIPGSSPFETIPISFLHPMNYAAKEDIDNDVCEQFSYIPHENFSSTFG